MVPAIFVGLVKKCSQGFLVYDCVAWVFFFSENPLGVLSRRRCQWWCFRKGCGGIIAASVSVLVFLKKVLY